MKFKELLLMNESSKKHLIIIDSLKVGMPVLWETWGRNSGLTIYLDKKKNNLVFNSNRFPADFDIISSYAKSNHRDTLTSDKYGNETYNFSVPVYQETGWDDYQSDSIKKRDIDIFGGECKPVRNAFIVVHINKSKNEGFAIVFYNRKLTKSGEAADKRESKVFLKDTN